MREVRGAQRDLLSEYGRIGRYVRAGLQRGVMCLLRVLSRDFPALGIRLRVTAFGEVEFRASSPGGGLSVESRASVTG